MNQKTKRPVLKVEKRKVLGRKVKRLRKEGILPASVYGREVRSLPVQADLKEVIKIWQQVGETGLVDLEIKGSKTKHTVILKNPHYDPITEKVSVAIPIEVVGEAPAVDKGGILVTVLDEVEVEALPTNLPEKIVVDVSDLKEIDQAITVADLPIDRKKVEVKVAGDQVVVKVEPPTEEEEEEKPAEETAEGEAQPEEKPAEAKGENSGGEGREKRRRVRKSNSGGKESINR